MHFFLITGPPAVGKMTIAQALCKRTGFKMFHNHQSIETALTLFNYGDPEFRNINNGIRQIVFDNVSQSKSLKGFIFTLVMGFELQEDWDYMNNLKDKFETNDWQFHIIELASEQSTRLQRNNTPNRLLHKLSKSDIEESSKNIIRMDEMHRMNSRPNELKGYSFLRINNNDLSPDEVTDQIIEHFKLAE